VGVRGILAAFWARMEDGETPLKVPGARMENCVVPWKLRSTRTHL
jgi:hypothetical protein